MSLPPGFLEELRARISVTQVVGRKVSWDLKKSNQSKGDMWAPCPFHQEKTASFHVDDQKGFYYCFGCHAKGDAISFVKETENVNFIEAVEILAKEAGLQMPEQDPQAKEKSSYRDELFKIMDLSVRFYQRSLSSAKGLRAREYINSRKLTSEITGTVSSASGGVSGAQVEITYEPTNTVVTRTTAVSYTHLTLPTIYSV